MRIHKSSLGILCCAFMACTLGPAEPSFEDSPSLATSSKLLRAQGKPIRNQYIVVLEDGPGVSAATVPTIATDLAARYGGSVRRTFGHALRGFSARLDEAQALALAADPAVKFVEEDGEVSLNTSQSNATWGLDRIDQANRPLNGTYNYDLTGANVNAYIIDTGIRITHTDFGGRAFSGFTSINDGNGTNDCHGHGTHVAGTVGGSTWGVAKGVRLFAVRVLSCSGSGSWEGVVAGIDWVTANHIKPAVANMSLGGGASPSVDLAVQNSVAAGVTHVVAAGNSSDDACNYSPARAPQAITVGSTDSSDNRSYFSNWGTCVDIFAPGSNITSAHHTSDTSTTSMSGTSMASPHVAGGVALYLEFNPTASPTAVVKALSGYSSPNKVGNPGTGSPNRLLFSNPYVNTFAAIPARHSAQCLSVSGASTAPGAQVVQALCSGASNQLFNLTPVGRDFQFVASHSGQCLNISGASAGAQANQQPCNGGSSQIFSLVSTGNGFFRFVAKHSGMCLNVASGGTNPGDAVTQEPCNGSESQSFRLN